MAERNEPFDEEEIEWQKGFARILLADVPQGFDTFHKLSRDVYENRISKDDYASQMERMVFNYPQLQLALNKVHPQDKIYRLTAAKDLLGEWKDWAQRWTADTNANNPSVYESHLFRCFLTIKAKINSNSTGDYVTDLEAKVDINNQEAEELQALRFGLHFTHQSSPINPPVDGDAITKYFKSVREIRDKDGQPDEYIYDKFKSILVAHGENLDYPVGDTEDMMKLGKVGVCQELCELFRDHKEKLSDFIQFLPHIGHISKNVSVYDV